VAASLGNASRELRMKESVESLVAYCRENDRVCPLPPLWNRLWEMLPGRSRIGVGWQSPPPLILAAWHDTPAMLKMLRLAEHIECAFYFQAFNGSVSLPGAG
jgi:hypothetical protein